MDPFPRFRLRQGHLLSLSDPTYLGDASEAWLHQFHRAIIAYDQTKPSAAFESQLPTDFGGKCKLTLAAQAGCIFTCRDASLVR